MNGLAPEVIYNVFSFLSYPEVYRLRSVSAKFQVMAEYHIYQQIKEKAQVVSIKLDGKKNNNASIELEAAHYDVKNRVIEFRPKSLVDSKLSLASTQQWSAYCRLLKIHFSGWFQNNGDDQCKLPGFESLSIQDKAMVMYHYQYNASIEKVYQLPDWYENKSNRYLGDKGFILGLSYQQPGQFDYSQQQRMTGLPASYYSYPTITESTPKPTPPVMDIKWIRVTLDWVLDGMVQSNMQQNQIYQNDFNRLNSLLAKEGCFKYDVLSEPVLNHIVNQRDQELSQSLIKYVHSHTHECHTRLTRLQHMLEGAGVDAQVIWKYTFAKSYVVGNGSLLSEEDVVRRIQDSEEEWRQKKVSLTRRLYYK
ncbi:hypothetical protein EDC94DRAFT_628210 [Helicostylum pulchrum]|uniref:F-box domain-containing protein n=1 Tax=Helicostylum pulchrum TaxID=562976 RepID=A0ABP9YBC7_9FUNG|nr:hypothetical protein EDC94DRAFT_628210 [Helicostylum pulchrum]